jgi:hypothetical protein
MSKNYRRKNQIAGQFSARTIAMMESPAFEVLSLSAHRILHRLEIEHAHHGGNDNGQLPCTFDDFANYGMDRHAIAPALREVVALGFVEITEQGRAGNAEWRRPNKFRLTYRPKDRAQPTNEWCKIKSIQEATMIAKAARAAENKKNSQCGFTSVFGGGNPTTEMAFHSGETHTTGHGGETTLLSISRTPAGSAGTIEHPQHKLPWSIPTLVEITDTARDHGHRRSSRDHVAPMCAAHR